MHTVFETTAKQLSLIISPFFQVKLVLESPPEVPDLSPPASPTDPCYESLVELTSDLGELRVQGADNSMGIFYVSLEGINSDDIVDQVSDKLSLSIFLTSVNICSAFG